MGKSSLALELARRLDGEILGADAFQIYRGVPLLTAQPSPDALAAVPHHLIGCLDPAETCDAARYTRLAREAISSVQSRGRRPILVGGTGLYLKALTHGLADLPVVDPALRAEIQSLSLDEALRRLAAADAEAPKAIDSKNPARVRRALEIVLSTRRPLAASRGEWNTDRGEFAGLVLTRDREDLHARIEANVDDFLARGALEEVRALQSVAGPGVRKAIGFRELAAVLAGELTLPEARARIVQATRQYAKRQLTWCRNQFNFESINLTVTPDPIDAALRRLSGSHE